MYDNAPAGYMPGHGVYNFGAIDVPCRSAGWPQLQHIDDTPQGRGYGGPTDHAVGELSGLEAG